MRTLLIIVTTPLFDDDLGFPERAEDLAVEQLIPQPGVEALPSRRRFACLLGNGHLRSPMGILA